MTYTVKTGDTLTKIATMYNTTVDAIVKANNIKDKNVIHVGQELIIVGLSTTQNTQVYNALITCLDAIEELPEFKTLVSILGV